MLVVGSGQQSAQQRSAPSRSAVSRHDEIREPKRLDNGISPPYLTGRLINHKAKYDVTPDRLSSVLFALADPTRRAILAQLAVKGDVPVTELAKPFRMSLPAVSKHLGVLEKAGLISRGREAQWRPARLEAAPLSEVSDWVERYRQFWEERFVRLDTYLAQLQKKEKGNARKKRNRK
jgi:DNA-binding transcriptional ArsR family regulator